MKTYLLSFVFLIFCQASFSQKTGKKIQKDSLLMARFAMVNEFLAIAPGDTIADIGTGAGFNLAPIASAYPGNFYVAEDLDSSKCGPASIQKYLIKYGNKISLNNFDFQYGGEKSTGLPSNKFHKVLLFDVLHEFTYKKEMLADIKRILKKNGIVYIQEILAYVKPKKAQRTCNYPFLTESEAKEILIQNGFSIHREMLIDTSDKKRKRYLKIFECRLE